MTSDVPLRSRIRNPGRRGIAADCYRFIPRFPLEALLRDSGEYRRLRYNHDALERKLALLEANRAPETRLRLVRERLTAAARECATYLLRNLPETEPEKPAMLARELDAEGNLVMESETAAQ